MQPYQNYFQPQMQTNYQSYNPYMQRMENLQQFQQMIQTPTMQPTQMSGANQFTPLGKIVESIDMVKATDIPMDGNIYYFPTADGNLIFGKQWMPNGQTRILTFKPTLDNVPNNLSNEDEKTKMAAFDEVLGAIRNEIKAINDKIDKISKPARSKKEVAEDE